MTYWSGFMIVSLIRSPNTRVSVRLSYRRPRIKRLESNGECQVPHWCQFWGSNNKFGLREVVTILRVETIQTFGGRLDLLVGIDGLSVEIWKCRISIPLREIVSTKAIGLRVHIPVLITPHVWMKSTNPSWQFENNFLSTASTTWFCSKLFNLSINFSFKLRITPKRNDL